MDTNSALDEAILDSELRHIKFFNGRLLTGGDLEDEQSAQHAHARHLGIAIGAGVAYGLYVTRASASPSGEPVVSVSSGLAVSRAGQTLRLECDRQVALTRAPDPLAKDACVFNDCDPAGSGATLASGTGYYVLTISLASLPQDKAPVSGLGNTTAICNSRFSAEGVKFSAFRLTLAANATPRAQSLLAQACFGLAPDISPGGWPGSLPAEYGWEKLMPPGFDGIYHVPLAVFEWTIGGTIGFLKGWPVRRRIARRNAVKEWAYFTSARRIAEGEAMFLDFQEDVAAAGAAGFAGTHFSLLPPGGVFPGGAAWKSFLGPLAPPFVTPIDASLWPRLLRDTFTREPVALPTVNAKGPLGEPSFAAIKVYEVPERTERLFARSPLGRLRIFPGDTDEELVAVIIRDANKCIRLIELVHNNDWPVVADDLPGPAAELLFLRAEEAREFVKKTSELDQAKEEVENAQAETAKAKKQASKARDDLEKIMKESDSDATGKKGAIDCLEAMKSMMNVFAQSEQLRYAEQKQYEAKAQYTYYQANAQPGGTPDAFEGTLQPPRGESFALFLRALRFGSPVTVKIVNGRTTDIEIPREREQRSFEQPVFEVTKG